MSRRPDGRRPNGRRRGLRRTALLSAVLLLPLLLGLAGFAWFLHRAAVPPTDPARQAEGIAVLTGGAERVETGFRLLLEDQDAQLIVSGVHRDVTPADLARMAALEPGALGSGVLAGRVTLGHQATSTRGNAAEIAGWARARHLRSIRVVTAGYHMPRALLELQRALPEAVLLPHPVVPARLRNPGAMARLRTWSLLVGEYLKLLGAALGLAPRPVPPPLESR